MPSVFVQNWLNDWDDSIKNWDLNPKSLSNLLAPFASLVGSSKLSADYLPEPYYGDPDHCSAVVLNINPGSSSPNEATKLWRNRVSPSYKLIYDFANSLSSKYSVFQSIYSPFAAPNWVPGVQWWKDNRNDFIKKIVLSYNKYKGRVSNPKHTPFAMELCPLHSNNVAGINFTQKDLRMAYMSNVITPAVDIIKTSDIPFGLGFASSICNLLQKPQCGGFQVIRTWKDGLDNTPSSTPTPIPNWPLDKKGMPKKRTYQLIGSTAFNKCDNTVYFLFTWDQSGSIIKITTNMMNDYAKVDDYIIQEIVKII